MRQNTLFSVLLFACLIACAGASEAQAPTAQQKRAFRVVAYLPDYRVDTLDPVALRYVTDLIYFSLAPTPTGELNQDRLKPDALKRLRDLTRRNHARMLIALGGWLHSDGFGPMATNPTIRARFIQNLTRFCLDNRLDGADFDWEGPANPAEEAAYAALLIETKRAFRPHGLRVTVALASWYHLTADALKAVDSLHIMAYDHDGRHSTLEQAKADVNAFIGQSVPRSKIYLGLPFYGRSILKRDQDLTYADIVRQYHPAPDVDEVGGIYFNGAKTIAAKTRYALENGFGGVMVWEIGQDTQDATSLLRALHLAASK